MTQIDVDIIVPVHNALALTRACVESLLANREPGFRLWLIDDASDSSTGSFLAQAAGSDPRANYVRNPQNIGFLKSCNLGARLGDAPFLLLLNSDALMPEGALSCMLECMHSDPRIASVNPLTNRASQIDLPMSPGSNFASMNSLMRKRRADYPDIVTGVGFCMLLRRSALEKGELFDEAYGFGYCEESDLCMRLTTTGWRTVIADNCYVYHRGSASFANRNERYLANRKIFDQRWAREYREQFAAYRSRNPLAKVRSEVCGQQRWDPMPAVWQSARLLRQMLKQRAPLGLARACWSGARALVKSRRTVFQPEVLRNIDRPGKLRVTYLLHTTVVAGGVLSVLQLVNGLVRLGVEARVATLFLDPAVRHWTPLLSEPIVFRDIRELINNAPHSDVVIATHWTTANWATQIQALGRASTAAYFVQDYEPWFAADGDEQQARQIADTYTPFEHLIAKSEWLVGKLADHDKQATKIPLGMDLDVFYPRDVAREPNTVVAMARPRTPRRGYATLISALQSIKQARPETNIVLFGDSGLGNLDIPFEFEDHGIVSDQNLLARLYSRAAVFIDSSDFQGFGRCALEAMACGAAAVVTGVGGVVEYARHQETTLVVAPKDPAAIVEATLQLVDDADYRSRLADSGMQVARSFDLRLEARRTKAFMQQIAAS